MLTMAREVEENWKILESTSWVARIWELGGWITELVEEWVNHGVGRRQSLSWRILKQARDKIDRVRVCLSEHLVEWVWFDLWELVLHVVRVHGANLIPGWGSKNLDDLDKLIDTGLSWEEWLSEHQLCHNTARRPHVNFCGVVRRAEDQLWCSVVSGADVRHVWLILHQDLGTAKVAELENTGSWVQQKVLWLDISVADALRMDVGESAEELVNVQLDLEDWHGRLHLVEVPRCAVDGLWNEFLDQVEVYLILLVLVSEYVKVQPRGFGYLHARRWSSRKL